MVILAMDSKSNQEKLLSIIENRFKKNMLPHKGIDWTNVSAKLKSNPTKLQSLAEMENTGGRTKFYWV